MTTETKLKNEKEVPMFEYNAAVQELLKISKSKKEEIDHHIVLATTHLSQLKQEHIRLSGEFNQWKMSEEQKFRNELSKKHNQIIDQENKINLLQKDLEQRSADLLVKEERYLDVQKDKNDISNARVEIEKLRFNATNLMAEADRKISEALSVMAQANTRVDESKRLDDKNNIRNQELCVREDRLQFDLKNFEIEKTNVNELREFVGPKIKEIKEIEDNISEAKKQIDIRHQEIINKEEENKIALKALEDKKLKLDTKERELNSKDEELLRKILISETKK